MDKQQELEIKYRSHFTVTEQYQEMSPILIRAILLEPAAGYCIVGRIQLLVSVFFLSHPLPVPLRQSVSVSGVLHVS